MNVKGVGFRRESDHKLYDSKPFTDAYLYSNAGPRGILKEPVHPLHVILHILLKKA
jgi:hypothetical protein